MPCLFTILVLAFPRVAMILIFLFSNYLERAYHGLLIPIAGFILLPVTTIVYAWLVNTHTSISGVYALALIVAVLIDMGGLGGGFRRRSN